MDEQRQAEPLPGIANENADGTEQMTKDIVPLGDIFRFMVELLDPWHPAAFLGLFHPISDQDNAILHHQERRMLAHDLEPLLPQRRKGPARRMEEMNERFVTPGIQREISNHRSNAQMVGAQHEADDNHNEPLERGFSREARTERLDKVVHVFKHRYGQLLGNGVNCFLQPIWRSFLLV